MANINSYVVINATSGLNAFLDSGESINVQVEGAEAKDTNINAGVTSYTVIEFTNNSWVNDSVSI